MRAYIFEKGTENIKCSVEKLEYNGQFMGENSVIVSAKSPKHIDFNIDDYVVFRGENFYLANIPTEKKTGDRNTKGDVFQYDNMKFMSVQYELNNADFNDFVGGSQTDISFTAQPNFSFVAATVTDLAQRIQVNMDRYYTGDKKWTIKVDNNYTTSDDNLNKLITISNITCWGALALFKSLYDTNFIVRGRTVTIGGSGSIKDITFKVGAYKGLWDMTRNSQTDQGIVTKLTSYGNTTNINPRYYSLIGVTVSAKISFASKYSITRSGVNDYIFQFDLSYSSELRTNINVTISGYTFDMVYGSYGEYSGWVISSGVSDRNSIGKSIYDSLAVDSKGTPTVTVSAIINSGARKDNISDLSHLSFDVNSKLPNNMNIMNLMLPAFPTQTLAEWVEENKSKYSWLQEYVNQGYAFSTERFYPCIYSKNKDVLGIRPHTEYFTSEDETHKDIYPSLQYFQDDRNQVVGATTLNGGTISDSGVFADGATVDPIYIIIPDLGFEFDDVYNGTQPKIHLNSGYCGGRDYTVKTRERDSSNNWKLKCDRIKDEAVGKWFPYVDAPIKKGDKFVITDIYMPDTYIEQTSVELLKWSMKWIVKNDYTVFSYQLTPDISFIKRHDDKITDKGTTFYRTVKEGDILLIEDTDIGVTGSITIDQIKITIGDGLLPKYDITLRDTKTVGTLQKVQQQIDALTGGGSGSGYNSSQIGEVAYAALKDKFLSKTNNDKANGLIGFEKGLETGTFQSGLLGSGAIIDAKGNSEVESIMSRTFMAAKSFVYNLVEVNVGERWSTNGFCKIKSVDTDKKIITEQLDSDEYSTMQLGDICRGIYSNIGNQYTTENKDADDCGFPTKYGFFTSYFSVTKIIESGKGISKFEYQLRTSTTPHPCALMQAAQYGSFTDGKRRASIFQSNYPHAYTENLEGVSTWVINSANITKRDGWLGDVEITLKNGTKQQLYGYGLYVQDNVYFGSAVIQLSPQTLADLQKELSNYIVSLTDYASSFTADAKGNIIGGLWFEDDLGNKQYRIHTAVSVANNNNIMLWLADSTKDATENKYKLYVQGIGCSAFISNSTVYITSIDNFNDGIATTDDGSKHTDEWYDIMRKTNSCSVNIIVDCEGKGSIVKTMNIGIKHTEEVFAIADLDNEMSNIRFSLKDGKYKGFDSSATGVTIKHNNVPMKIKNIVFGTLPSGITAAYTLSTDSLSAVITFASSLTTDTLTDFNVPITVVGTLAGVDYESTLYKKFTKIEGTATYELSPSTGSIGATYDANGNKVLSTDKISCGIKCYDDSGENYDLTSAQQTDRSITLSYVVYDASGNSIKNGNASVGDNISLTSASYKIVFTLIIASKTVDEETIYVNADGKSSFTFIRFATDNKGSGITATPTTSTSYIGIIVKNSSIEPSATEYVWIPFFGQDGESYQIIYKLTSSNTAPSAYTGADQPTSTTRGDWTDNPLSCDATSYPYQFESMRTKSNGVWSSWSTPSFYNRYAKDGRGVTMVDVVYNTSTSNSVAPTDWLTDAPNMKKGDYLWSANDVYYTDGPDIIVGATVVTSADNVKTVVEQYNVNTSRTSAPSQNDSGWGTASPTATEGSYIWTRSKITYQNGDVEYTNPVCVTGNKGDKGDKGDSGDKGEKGDKGNTGSRGFIVYPAGEWSSTTTYTNDGDNAPMVLYSGLYYILNVVTSVKGTNPASDTTNWKVMSMTDYIFTKVLFANFAKLGSAVFSGDYMFSQYGTYNGTAYTDGSYISQFSGNFMTNTATSTEFIPYYCVNLKTGKTYQSNAYIKGKVVATSGNIGGLEITSSVPNVEVNKASVQGFITPTFIGLYNVANPQTYYNDYCIVNINTNPDRINLVTNSSAGTGLINIKTSGCPKNMPLCQATISQVSDGSDAMAGIGFATNGGMVASWFRSLGGAYILGVLAYGYFVGGTSTSSCYLYLNDTPSGSPYCVISGSFTKTRAAEANYTITHPSLSGYFHRVIVQSTQGLQKAVLWNETDTQFTVRLSDDSDSADSEGNFKFIIIGYKIFS